MPRKANNAATTEAATATCKGKNNWKLQKKGRKKKQQQEAAAAAENVTQSQSEANPNTPVQISVGNATHVAYEWREFMYACPTV